MLHAAIILAGLFACFALSVSGSSAHWLASGPTYAATSQSAGGIGSINSIASSADYSTWFIGASNGGVWKSTNVFTNGVPTASPHWTPLSDQNLCNSAASVSVSNSDPNFVSYSCAGVSSFYKISGPMYGAYISTNGGSEWTLAPLPYGLDLNRIHVFGSGSGGSGQIIAAAKGRKLQIPNTPYYQLDITRGGVWFSNNSGASFQQSNDPLVHDVSIKDIQVDYVHGSVYAYDYKGNLLLSQDFGVSWSILQPASVLPWSAVNFRIAIGAVSGGPNIITMTCDQSNDGIMQWTTDHGKTWKSASIPSDISSYGGIFFFTVLPDPVHPNLVYLAGAVDSVYVADLSQPASSMFTSLSGGALHADHRFLFFAPPFNTLMLSCDGGLFGLQNPQSNGATNWLPLNGDLQVTEFDSFAYEPKSNTYASGAQDNGVWMSNASSVVPGNEFYNFVAGDGEAASFNIQNHPPVLYFAYQSLNQEFVYPLGTNPANAGSFMPTNSESYFESIIRTNAVNNNLQLLCTNPGCVQVTFQDPTNPSTITQTVILPTLMITDYFYGGYRNGQADPNVVFAVYANVSVFAQDSHGSQNYTNNAGWFLDKSPYGDPHLRISHNPQNYYQILAVTSESRVFYTDSFGAKWTDCTGNLFTVAGATDEHPFGWANAVIPVMGGKDVALVVGTALGIYVSYASQQGVWTALGGGFPHTLVSNLHYSPENNLLLAATLGRGWWTLPNAVQVFESQYQKYYE